MLASFPGRSFPFFNYWRGRKREPGIHCVRMRQLHDAADASTMLETSRIVVWAGCMLLIFFVLSTMKCSCLCRLCHESVPSKLLSLFSQISSKQKWEERITSLLEVPVCKNDSFSRVQEPDSSTREICFRSYCF